MRPRNKLQGEAFDCFVPQCGGGSGCSHQDAGDGRIPTMFQFPEILGLSLPLNHCVHHKLLKRETTEILLDSVCECMSGYVSHVIPAWRGSGKYGTSCNSPRTNQSGWVRAVKSGIVLNTPLPQRMPSVSYEEGPLHVPSGLD